MTDLTIEKKMPAVSLYQWHNRFENRNNSNYTEKPQRSEHLTTRAKVFTLEVHN